MARGRPRIYDEPIVITLKCERRLHDAMIFLEYSDRDVYTKGALDLMGERESDLTEEHVQTEIQILRRKMAETQEHIAHMERLMMDTRIKREMASRLKKKNIETRIDDRGREYQVVIAQ